MRRYPHDPEAFSQGLLYHDGVLYESTGLYGQSTLRASELWSGKNLHRRQLDDAYFAEGLALAGEELVQLSWKSGKVFRYRLADLEPVQTQQIEGELWGLASDGEQLVSSNGSANLSFRDSQTLSTTRELTVKFGGRPLNRLNELEWINGCLYANIWMTDNIAVINPESGQTLYTIDLASLAAPELKRSPENIANGIAHRADNGNLLLTGKNWRWLYEVKLLTAAP